MDLGETAEWLPVDLGDVEARGVLWGWDRAWVYGCRRPTEQQIPFIADVRDDGTVTEYDVPAQGPLTSACRLEMQVGLSIGEAPPRVLYVNDDEPRDPTLEEDDSFDGAVRVWLTMGSEDPFYVAEWEDGRLTSGEFLGEDHPEGDGLRRAGRPEDLLVGSSEGEPYVAGLLAGGDDSPAMSMWTCGGDMGQFGPGGWARRRFDPEPDAYTQIVSSTTPRFAGHVDGRPVLFDLGRRIDVPEVALDPRHPQVLAPWGRHAEVALQSRDEGPQLWTRRDDRWSPRSLPPGRLGAADICTTSQMVWVVVDGTLWRPVA